ncbi:MAG: serine protein kinase RIO [Zestosphaera sp.]
MFETVEEVFDRATVQAVLKLMRKGVIRDLKGVVSAGKESRVYWGKGPEGRDLAVKIYLTSSAEFRKGMMRYIIGDYRFDKSIPKSTRKLVILWAKKEFNNFTELLKAGVSVPEPIDQYENVLVMEFIGDDGVRAPLLKETNLTAEEYSTIFQQIIEDVRKAYLKAKLVHGDLSEYNVMIWNKRHYIIDVSQAVPITHPNATNLLQRDLRNIIRFFEYVGVNTPTLSNVLEYITGKTSKLELE